MLWKGIILVLDFDQAKIKKKNLYLDMWVKLQEKKKKEKSKATSIFLKDRLPSKKQNVY